MGRGDPRPQHHPRLMRLAVLGAGPIGALSAALAAKAGHEVALVSPRGAPRMGTARDGRIAWRCTGGLAWEGEVALLDGIGQLADWPAILLAIPGDAYPAVLPALQEVLRPGQTVICGGALSLAPLWLAERTPADIVAWGTTLGTARILPDRTVQVGTLRGRFEQAALPAARADALLALTQALFGDHFTPVGSLLIPLLSNINPVAHAGQVIPNLSRMERGEAWQLFDHFRETGARIAGAVDAERIAVAASYGVQVRSLARHYHLSYHVPEGGIAEIAAGIEAKGLAPRGPAKLAHRYLDEDIPFGLVVYETLGALAGVKTPMLSAAITVLSCAADRPFRTLNPLLDDLGLTRTTPAELARRCAG